MAVHGRYRQPCPVCGAPVQRIVYARNEANYCAPCQTGGRLLSDRALSRLLRDDWPKTLEEMERRLAAGRARRDASVSSRILCIGRRCIAAASARPEIRPVVSVVAPCEPGASPPSMQQDF